MEAMTRPQGRSVMAYAVTEWPQWPMWIRAADPQSPAGGGAASGRGDLPSVVEISGLLLFRDNRPPAHLTVRPGVSVLLEAPVERGALPVVVMLTAAEKEI